MNLIAIVVTLDELDEPGASLSATVQEGLEQCIIVANPLGRGFHRCGIPDHRIAIFVADLPQRLEMAMQVRRWNVKHPLSAFEFDVDSQSWSCHRSLFRVRCLRSVNCLEFAEYRLQGVVRR